jgi:4-amino-4-deoxychorismate lyase
MSMRTLINGRPADQVSAADRGLHYGDGLFETITCRDGHARWLPLHLARLERGCARLGIEAPDAALLGREIAELASHRSACIVKLILTRGVARGRGYRPAGDELPTRVLARHPWPPAPPPWRLGLSAVRLAENALLAGLKHLNRLEQVLAQRDRHPDADEVLMLSGGGEVISGSMSNLFLIESGRLVTPSLERCGVEGVMRRLVLDSAAAAGWAVDVEPVDLQRVRAADALFMTNVRLGLHPVASFQDRVWPGVTQPGRLEETIDACA